MDNKRIIAIALPVLCLVVIGLIIFLTYKPAIEGYEAAKKIPELSKQLKDLNANLEALKIEKANQQSVELEGSKVIYENAEFKFSPEASFAPLIEKIIDIAKISGVRVHSIDYNYAPVGDSVFDAQYPGYNVCELSVTAVGKYNNFQRLFATIVADTNVMNLAEIDITPWDSDHSVLVGKFKLRLYTKTM